ncbi:MAG: DUF6485 family protein [Planctomycetota bacterium]|nr:DUF6485 family protein [Planctomycetota bacterium]
MGGRKKECPNQQENRENCPCTWRDCDKKGYCCECLKSHLSRKELPACAFPSDVERSYDRSFERFVKTYGRRG